MGDPLLAEKLELLLIYYPTFLISALDDLLRSCDYSVENTRTLIDGPKPKKRSNLYQRSIAGHITKRQKQNDHKDGVIKSPVLVESETMGPGLLTLYTPQDVDRHLGQNASFYPNFLPEKLANELLTDLMNSRSGYRPNEFYLFGNLCKLAHDMKIYSKFTKNEHDLVYNGIVTSDPAPYTESFTKASELLTEFMNEKLIPLFAPLPFQTKMKWEGDYCVVNFYQDLQNNLEYHSDRLSHIGPHNYVASVSLGCTRMFRMKSTYKKNSPTFQIPLPHNSLFIMRPGCQEEYKHSIVSMAKPVSLHPQVGAARFGLTFRFFPRDFISNIPRCSCNLGMTLRRSFKTVATRGRYFWLCENLYRNKDCGGFHWADFSNVEDHFVAKSLEDASVWFSPDDQEKIEYEKIHGKNV